MRKEKSLIALLKGIVTLLAEELMRNPELAKKLDALLLDLAEHKPIGKKASNRPMKSSELLPDIHAEWKIRGEDEFRFWLKDQQITVLRALIKSQDFDPMSKTKRWNETEKLAAFIADSLRSRMTKGSAFIGKSNEISKPISD